MILLIDNYDSFTYNIAQYLSELGEDVQVKRNDALDIEDIYRLAPEGIVISPGPGAPVDAGISLAVVKEFVGVLPILGICLGHQVIGYIYGGNIVQAPVIMHGKTSKIEHNNEGLFEGLPSSFIATRYHSLMVEPGSLNSEMKVTAWTSAQDASQPGHRPTIMAIQHKKSALYGIQFHPESIMTEHGHAMLRRFLFLGAASMSKH